MADSVTITDNRTGESIEIPIEHGGVAGAKWKELLPATRGSTTRRSRRRPRRRSAITDIDGDKGILRYRGYPIEQLAEQSTYLEVAYLLIHGELPTAEQNEVWTQDITYHTFIHENMRKRFLEGFHYDAHPMGMLVSAVAALSTFYDNAKDIDDPEVRYRQIVRLIAKMPTLAAACHRFSVGMPFVYPDNDLDLHRELPVDDVEDRRAPLRGRSRARPGARRAVHPPRRPRAELRHDRHADRRLGPRRPLLARPRRGCRALRTAATVAPTRP